MKINQSYNWVLWVYPTHPHFVTINKDIEELFFSVRLLSVLRGHSVFLLPATTANDLRLRRIFYAGFNPLHLFSYLNSWKEPVFIKGHIFGTLWKGHTKMMSCTFAHSSKIIRSMFYSDDLHTVGGNLRHNISQTDKLSASPTDSLLTSVNPKTISLARDIITSF